MTLVQSLANGFAALGTLLGQLHTQLGWRCVARAHAGTWGCPVYVLETGRSGWRVRRIAADGTQAASTSADAANAGLGAQAAWGQRGQLVFVVLE